MTQPSSPPPEDPIPLPSYEEFVRQVEERGGTNPEEAVVASFISVVVSIVAKRFGVDPKKIVLASLATAATAPALYRTAKNYMHYKKTGERKPFMTASECRRVGRALEVVGRIIANLGKRIRIPSLLDLGYALVIAGALLINQAALDLPPMFKPTPITMAARYTPPQMPARYAVMDQKSGTIRITASMPQMPWSMGTRATVELTNA